MKDKKKINVKEFLEKNNIKFYETDTHFQANCFLCNETRNRLGINKETGKWNCFNCDSKSKKASSLIYAFTHKANIKTKHDVEKDEQQEKCTIQKDFHLEFYENLKDSENYDSLRYLIEERKLSKACIKFFQLGARSTFTTSSGKEYEAGEHLAIPYLKGGACVNVKYRALDPDVDKKNKWRREKGGVSALFNDQALDDMDYKTLFIAEAEVDAMSLWTMGIKNVVALTVGAKGFKDTWYERLRRFEKIYLVLDRDEAGQIGAEKLAKRLGMGRCYNIILPEDTKDPNDFIKKYELNDFNKLVDQASQFEIRGVVSLKESFKQLVNRKNNPIEDVRGFETRWPKMNKVIGKFKNGNLVIISGKPKAGKTTWILDLATDLAEKGVKGGMYSCEMQHMALTEKVVAKISSFGFHPSYYTFEDLDDDELGYIGFKMRHMHKNFHMYYPEMGDLELDKVVARITEMVQRYDLKYFIFDNLHFLCRGDDEKTMIDKATQAFKLLAENLGIVFFLLTHPRKTNHNRQLTNEDLKGSSSIFQDADLIILMHRRAMDGDMLPEEMEAGVSEGAMSARAEFLITGRFVEGGKTYLAYHGERSMFKDRGTLFNTCMKDLTGMKKQKKKGF